MGRLILLAALLAVAAAFALRDEDLPVPRDTPEARRAVALAREVVPGRLVDLRRDTDNGKWEVTLRQGDHDYEVELDPRTLALLRVDYD